jgi:hypothetical protein
MMTGFNPRAHAERDLQRRARQDRPNVSIRTPENGVATTSYLIDAIIFISTRALTKNATCWPRIVRAVGSPFQSTRSPEARHHFFALRTLSSFVSIRVFVGNVKVTMHAHNNQLCRFNPRTCEAPLGT